MAFQQIRPNRFLVVFQAGSSLRFENRGRGGGPAASSLFFWGRRGERVVLSLGFGRGMNVSFFTDFCLGWHRLIYYSFQVWLRHGGNSCQLHSLRERCYEHRIESFKVFQVHKQSNNLTIYKHVLYEDRGGTRRVYCCCRYCPYRDYSYPAVLCYSISTIRI